VHSKGAVGRCGTGKPPPHCSVTGAAADLVLGASAVSSRTAAARQVSGRRTHSVSSTADSKTRSAPDELAKLHEQASTNGNAVAARDSDSDSEQVRNAFDAANQTHRCSKRASRHSRSRR
jgi:hypothetical protein